jgi:plasmid stability protein
VEERVLPEEREPMKRLTIDIPESLHRTIKVQCALRGRKIADEVRELLLQKYGKVET